MLISENRPAQLTQLSDRLGDPSSLHSVPTSVLVDGLETILKAYSTYARAIVSELDSRNNRETRICTEQFDNIPMSVFCRVEPWLD